MCLGLYYLVANHELDLLSLFRRAKVYTISRPIGAGPWVGRSASGPRLWLVVRSIPVHLPPGSRV